MKIVNAAILCLLSTNLLAQQWNGSTNTTGQISRSGDVLVDWPGNLSINKNSIQSVHIGPAWGGGGLWGQGYLGFNLFRNTSGVWPYNTDGSSNSGGVMFVRAGGDFVFSCKTTVGTGSGTLSDAQITDNTKFQITSDGTVRVGGDYIQRVSIGPAWGGGGIYGMGYIGFNLFRNKAGGWDYVNNGATNGGVVMYSGVNGDLFFSTKASTGATSGTLSDVDIVNNSVFRINSDGKLIIGKPVNGPTPSLSWNTVNSYKLYVEGGVLTERVRVAVKNTSSWADYVFAPTYQLLPLPALQKYIAEHNHLPEVPSATEVVANGLDMAEMDAKLLMKVEELTLYLLQQQKEIDELKAQLKNQKN